MKKQLIIFDMDGTLINSGDVIANTINFVRVNIGLKKMPKEELLSSLNNPDINAADFFYGTSEFTPEQTKLFTQYYDMNCIKDIVLYDGIKEMLEIVSQNFILTIATNASIEFATKMVEHLEIDHYFDLVVGATCVKYPKPKPDMLLYTMEKLNIQNNNTLMIGDSLKDQKAANAAKIDTILVNWGFTEHTNTNIVLSSSELTKKILEFTN